jgi:nucleotide-binding universal stress UspA family protein
MEVIAGSGLSLALASYAFSSPSLPAAENEMYAETKANLEQVAGELGGGVPVHLQTIRGDPSGALIERSSSLDILMLGSRAYGPLRHTLLGSVSARVMREAHRPVLVVPRGSSTRLSRWKISAARRKSPLLSRL